ncbi:MAG: TonB-dependent receptor [Prolixibacteraceae bacterium]|nr:TonB-dependent receptor [Prolixibacteraceae bacterium]
MKQIKYFTAAIISLLAINGYAQEITNDSVKTIELNEVTISALRSRLQWEDIPQSVSVIKAEDIAVSPYNNVEDIIRSIPGVHNFRHSSLHTNGIVSPVDMRGVGKNRVLILVDGVPQNDNFNNSIAWVAWGHIPKEAIERIEILRGSSSTLYGSEGLGGVINIITKKPAEKRASVLQANAGNASSFGGNAFYSQRIKNFGFLVSGGYEETDGFYMVEDPEDYEIKRWRKKGQIFGKLLYDFNSRSKLEFSALYFNQNAGQGREFFRQELMLNQYAFNYLQLFNNFRFRGTAYLNQADKTAYQDNAADNYTTLNREEKFKNNHSTGLDAEATIFKWQLLDITFGGSYKYINFNYDEDYSDSDRDAGAMGNQQHISPFLFADVKLLNNSLFFNLGFRYDFIQTSGAKIWDTQASAGKPAYDITYNMTKAGSLSPSFGISWHPDPKTTIRTSAGKGFRMPSLFELYKVHVRGGGTYYREANPDLKPENIQSWDIGAERKLSDNLIAKFSFYQSLATDYIGDRFLDSAKFSGGTKTRYEYKLDNISEVKIHGLEIETQWSPLKYTSFNANYTYNISEIVKDSENQSLEGNYLPNNPRHSGHFIANYLNPDFINIALGVNVFAKIFFDNENTLEKDSYCTIDLSLSRKFINLITLYMNAENILNNKYPIFLSPSSGNTIAPGIIINAGIKVEF